MRPIDGGSRRTSGVHGRAERPIRPQPVEPDPALTALDLVRAPVWIFDTDCGRVHWANTAGLVIWNATSLSELRARDMGAEMSRTVADRLAQYQADFVTHASVFSEHWTHYPGRAASYAERAPVGLSTA